MSSKSATILLIESLHDVIRECDELTNWYNRYEGGMITHDVLIARLGDFVKWYAGKDL